MHGVEMTLTATREVVVEPGDLAPLLSAAPPPAPPAASRSLYIFVAVASIGGLLFGYDTGVISGALPYLRDDLLQSYADDPARLARVQEVVVSSAIVAAGVGSASGGMLSDRLGRRRALLAADVLFAAGAAAMAAAQGVGALVAGRALVGLGVGLASVTVPIYIGEAAPPQLRGRLITWNVFFITGGQFLAYVFNYLFSFAPSGQWRWMLGAAALPSLAQMAGLLLLPESPAWLAARGRVEEARAALALLQPSRLARMQQRQAAAGRDSSSADEAAAPGASSSRGGDDEASGMLSAPGSPKQQCASPWRLLASPAVLRELHVGVGLQVLQQLAGINTIMYYSPAIIQLAGFHDKQTVLLLALIPAGANTLGTLVGAACIDRHGRRRLLLCSTAGVALALAALGAVFRASEASSPAVLAQGSTCPVPVALADCTACLHAGCGFCGSAAGDLLAPGTCLALDPGGGAAAACANSTAAGAGGAAARMLFTAGCPSSYTWWILAGLLLYLAAFAPGLGPVPWAINAELYPLDVRGLATGLAATANWLANAAVAQTFLSLTHALGGSGAFWCYAALALGGLAWVAAVLPETAGLTLDEVQQVFVARAQQGRRQAAGWGGGGGGGWPSSAVALLAPWRTRRRPSEGE